MVFGWILDVFEDSAILTEKQRPKPRNSSSLKVSACFDNLVDPMGAKVNDEMILEANTPVWKGLTQNPAYFVFEFQIVFTRSISEEINEQLMKELAIHQAKSDDRYN